MQHIDLPLSQLSRYRLGIARAGFEVQGEESKIFKAVLEQMSASGATLLDPADIPCIPEIFASRKASANGFGWDAGGRWTGRAEDLVVCTHMYDAVNHWLGCLKSCPIKTAEDLMQWNKEHPVRR